MAAPILKVYTTTSERINSLPIKNGQLIFLSDLNLIYFDYHDIRLKYPIIQELETDQDRLTIPHPIPGFYFVQETGIMWRYKTNWTQITDGNAPHYIYGQSVSDFPPLGDEKLIYSTDEAIYRWDRITQSYECISNKTAWKRIGKE